MPNRARDYHTTLFNGSFKGCRKIFSNTDVISAIAIPREFRSEIKTHIKSNVNVVYLLLGDENGESIAYVGRTRRTGKRPTEHSRKNFWNELIFFFSSHQFTTEQLEYLEALLYFKLQEAGRVKLDNRIAPLHVLPELTAGEQTTYDSFYEQIVTLTGLAGYDILNQEYSANDNEIEFYCENDRGAHAIGYFRDNTIFVQKGSVFSELTGSGSDYNLPQRIDELKRAGILVQKNGKWVIQREWKAKSPSDAARCILGHQSNGWNDWKDSDDKTLSEYFRS